MATSKDKGVTMADASALNGGDAPASEAPAVARPDIDPSAPVTVKVTDREGNAVDASTVFISEGMRHDLVTLGEAADPNTGNRVELA